MDQPPRTKATAAEYPGAGRRIKGALFDGMLLLGAWLLLALLTRKLEPPLQDVRTALLIALPIAYEPLLVSLRGQTVGHARYGLLVVRAGTGNRVALPWSVLRWAFKWVIGWYSLLLVVATTRRQAVHDAVGRTVVVDDIRTEREITLLAQGVSVTGKADVFD